MKLISNKKSLLVLMPFLIGLGIFAIGASARAGWATDIMSGLLSVFIWALGIILGLVLQGLIAIAGYQHFIDSQAVVLGWVIVRDICNMFFVVVLMIIAFGTILHLEEYNYKKWLPKLIMMAVLINFSKTICGLLIDVTQVAMLTFVNAFKDIGGGNATEMLGIKDIVTLSATDNNTGFLTVVGAYVLGIIYLIVSIVVIVTMMMMLVMRLVMIWIYVVLSPAAYLLAAFPGGQKYSSQWWSEFTKNLIVGPILAFFIWLSLAALGTGNDMNNIDTAAADKNNEAYSNSIMTSADSGGMTKESSFAGTNASKPSALIKFVIAIGMLVGGLMVSQQIGGAAGSLAGKGMSKLQNGASSVGKMAGNAAKWTAKRPLSVASWANDRFLQGKGIMDLNLSRVKKGWDTRSEEKKQQRYIQGKTKASQRMEESGTFKGALALSALGEDTFDHLTTWRGIKQTVKGGKRMKRDREAIDASPELEQAKFELAYAKTDDPEERAKKREELRAKDLQIDSDINANDVKMKNIEGDLRTTFDPEKREKLEKNKKDLEAERSSLLKDKLRTGDKLAYAQQNSRTVYTAADKERAQSNVDGYHQKMDNNVPMTNYSAKMSEQGAIQKELAKLSLTTDSDELLRLLKSALQSKDTAKASAIMTKLTKDGNDNELTKALDKNGDTSWLGLQRVMKDIANPNSKNYGGFTEQQAYSLGASLSELNKSTQHWEAVGGFEMKSGQWRLTDEEGAAAVSLTESGKKDPQDLTKSGNRLAYGKYVDGIYQLTAAGIARLKTISGPGNLSNVKQRMNESAAKNILPQLVARNDDGSYKKDKDGKYSVAEKYAEHFSDDFINAMSDRLGKIQSSNVLEEFRKVKDIKNTIS